MSKIHKKKALTNNNLILEERIMKDTDIIEHNIKNTLLVNILISKQFFFIFVALSTTLGLQEFLLHICQINQRDGTINIMSFTLNTICSI